MLDKSLARGLSRREVRRITAGLAEFQQALDQALSKPVARLNCGRRLGQGEPRVIATRCSQNFENYGQTINERLRIATDGNRAQMNVVIVAPRQRDVTTHEETVLSLQNLYLYADRRRIVTGQRQVMVELGEHALRRFFQRGGGTLDTEVGEPLATEFWSLAIGAMMQRRVFTRTAEDVSLAVPFAQGILLGNACVVRAVPEVLHQYYQYGSPGGAPDPGQGGHPMQLPNDEAVLIEYRTWIAMQQLSARQRALVGSLAALTERYATACNAAAAGAYLGRPPQPDEDELLEAQRKAGERMADLLTSAAWIDAFGRRGSTHPPEDEPTPATLVVP